MKQRARRILFLSDMHCGHRAGLTPPDWQSSGGGEASAHDTKKARRVQGVLWKFFADSMKEIQPVYAVIVNGDAIDGRNQKTGGVELLVPDREEQADMAAVSIREAKAGRIFMVYGTPYHVGEEENWEDLVAKEVKAERIEGEGHYDIDSCQIASKHFIGNTSSPVSRFTALSSAQIKQLLWAEREQQPRANILVRSHVHRCVYVGEPGAKKLACTTPCLQGLGVRFPVRQGDYLPVDFGFIYFDIQSDGSWTMGWRIAPLSLQQACVLEL